MEVSFPFIQAAKPKAPSPRTRRRAVLELWLANAVVGLFLGSSYLRHVPDEVDGLRLGFFALFALVSSVVSLTLLPGILFTAWAHFIGVGRMFVGTMAGVWSLFHVLLFADTRIYNVFRYHFGSQVWNLLYTRGSEDSVNLGWQVYLAVGAGFAGMIAVQLFLWRRLLVAALQRQDRESEPFPRKLLRPATIGFALLFGAIFVDKTLYAQAHLSRDRQVTALSRLFPMYTRLPLDDMALAVGVAVDERPRVELEGVRLEYPLAPLVVPADGERPSFLLVVLDCWRRDMLSPEVTPRLSAYAESCLRFENHVSAGNSTRFGLLSLLYGLPGSYWPAILAEKRSPVLLDILLDEGYDVRVFSSATMSYPEMRETAWSKIPDAVEDAFSGEFAWQRDEEVAAAFADWQAQRAAENDERPFFAFVLLDAPHQTYSHPPDVAPFQPSALGIDYMSLSAPEGPAPAELEAVFNRYRNAVHHADRVAGDILATVPEDTWVIATGDHGEEFLENGFFGHTSGFTPQQVEVPLLLRAPHIAPGREGRPTSHLDVPATLLEALGADRAARADYTCGLSLFEPLAERDRVLSGWNELGVWTDDAVVRIPLSLLEFEVECYDYEWNFLPDDEATLLSVQGTLRALAEDCNRYLR